jgi:hypothetical protein
VPAQTHNVLGYTECTLTIRNAWVDHPDRAPAETGCLAGLRITFPAPD